MRSGPRRLATCLAFLLLGSLAVSAAKTSGYHLLNKYTLGGEGRWDYLVIDSETRHLFVTRFKSVVVLDAESGKQLAEIPGTQVAHGVALAKDLGRGFITSGPSNTFPGTSEIVTIFDLKTFQVLDRVDLPGTDPDNIVYDPVSRHVFVFGAGTNKAAAVLDAETGKVIGSVPLGGAAEHAELDGKGHIFDNIRGANQKNEVIEIDIKTNSVINRYSLGSCESPSGMGMDRKHMRLFIGCRNEMMTIMDADTGKVIATPHTGEGVDANAFDPGTGFAFASNGQSGTMTVVHEDSPNKFTVIDNVKTELGARTMMVDPKTHKVFLVTAQLTNPDNWRNNQRDKSIVPGTITLLVYGR